MLHIKNQKVRFNEAILWGIPLQSVALHLRLHGRSVGLSCLDDGFGFLVCTIPHRMRYSIEGKLTLPSDLDVFFQLASNENIRINPNYKAIILKQVGSHGF